MYLNKDIKLDNKIINILKTKATNRNQFYGFYQLYYEKLIYRIIAYKNIKNKLNYIEVLRIDENLNCIYRNISFNYVSGYNPQYPNTKTPYYYTERTYKVYEWTSLENIPNITINNESNLPLIANKHKTLKFLLNKFNSYINYNAVFHLINLYRIHPEIEYLVKYKFYNIALNKNLYKLSFDKKKQIINKLKEINHDQEFILLKDIKKAIDLNLSMEKYYKLKDYNFDEKLYNILESQNITSQQYNNFINLANRLHKDINKSYWKYPKNFNIKIQKLQNQQANLNIALQRKENKKRLKEINKINNKINYINNLYSYSKMIDDYLIQLPINYDDIIIQANKLSQYLISAQYDQKFIKQKSILVFIKKDNEPIATVELDKKLNILQFYCNEFHRIDCLPSDDLKNTFNKWLKTLKIKNDPMATF